MNRSFALLERTGILLKTDRALPSVTTLVAGEPVQGSWWGHPVGRTIFAEISILAEHPDVLQAKLIGGKDTFIHRRHWSELYAVATAGEAWQLDGLSAGGQELLDQVQHAPSVEAAGDYAGELETRLLAHAQAFHSPSGEHRKHLESWHQWARRSEFQPEPIPAPDAKRRLEALLPDAPFAWLLRRNTRKS